MAKVVEGMGGQAHSEASVWVGWSQIRFPAYLPAALAGLLFEVQAPAVRAGLSAVVHGKDDWPREQDSWRPTANDGTQQGLTAS